MTRSPSPSHKEKSSQWRKGRLAQSQSLSNKLERPSRNAGALHPKLQGDEGLTRCLRVQLMKRDGNEDQRLIKRENTRAKLKEKKKLALTNQCDN